MGKTRQSANLVSDNNIFVDVVNDRVGIGTENPRSKLDVLGNVNVSGIITASNFYGNGSGLTGVANTGFVVSTATTTASLNVTGNATIQNLTVNGTQTIINTTSLEIADKTVGIASNSTKLNDVNLDGAGIIIYGSQGDKTITWNNANSRMSFSTDVYAPRYYGDGSQLTGVGGQLDITSSLFT